MAYTYDTSAMNSEPTSSYLAADGRNTNPKPTAGNDVPRAVDTLHQQCPNCAHAAARIAADSRRIADLEAQVQFLTVKASAAGEGVSISSREHMYAVLCCLDMTLTCFTLCHSRQARRLRRRTRQTRQRTPAGSAKNHNQRPRLGSNLSGRRA